MRVGLGDGEEMRHTVGSSTSPSNPIDRPVRQGGDRGLQVEHAGDRDADDRAHRAGRGGAASWSAPAWWCDRPAPPNRIAVLEHVTAVKWSRLPRCALSGSRTTRGRLRSPRVSGRRIAARAGDHGQIVVHHDRVLDEDRVRAAGDGATSTVAQPVSRSAAT